MALVGAFAALSLVIAVLGVYSVMAYAVIGRTREFGIRQALGASSQAILVLVLRQGLAAVLVGVVVGLALSALTSRFVAALLVGVSTHDVLTFVLAPAVVVVAGTAACLIPARAATRVHPVDALRAE
jgi:putative ABC transport system permease protein